MGRSIGNEEDILFMLCAGYIYLQLQKNNNIKKYFWVKSILQKINVQGICIFLKTYKKMILV